MQQFKIRKSAEEILGTYARHLKKGEAEFHTSDGFKIVVQHLGLQPSETPHGKPRQKSKSLYGAFPQLKEITDKDIEKAKKIFEIPV